MKVITTSEYFFNYIKPILEQNFYMAYFNYHAKAQGLIKSGHCVKAEIVEEYKNISPALILYFDNQIPMPICLHRFDEYFELLKQYEIKVESK